MYRVLLLFVLLVAPVSAGAQLTLPQNASQLSVRPELPQPGQTVTVQLNDFSLSGANRGVTWYVNGSEQPDATNQRNLTLTAGAVGEQTIVRATTRSTDGQVLSVQETFTVSDVVLVVEADTYTPSWYPGRAAPSIGSAVTVTAFPVTGSGAAPQSYTYQWQINNQVVQGGTIAGGYQQRFTMPRGRGATVSVDVYDATGAVVARKRVLVEGREPELFFYTVNPLRGVEPLALPARFPLVSEEMSVRAEPFFVDTNLFSTNPISEWSVNNQAINNPNEDQRVITLRNAGGTGSFLVEYHIRNPRQLLQGAEAGFNVTF